MIRMDRSSGQKGLINNYNMHFLIKQKIKPLPTQAHFISFFQNLENLLTVKILKFGTSQTIAIIVLKLVKFDVTLH